MQPMIKTIFILCFFAFGLESKVAQRILYKIKRAAVIKIAKGPGSLEKLSNRLTGHKSEWLLRGKVGKRYGD